MIKIYYRGSCNSSQRALVWFEKYHIEILKRKISRISKNDLLELLQLSDNGLQDIVKSPSRSSSKVRKALKYIDHLSLNEALDYIITHPYVLQTPIIMQGNNHLIGYNNDEIRKFLPKDYRRCHLKK